MQDLHRALTDSDVMREQVAREAELCGYIPYLHGSLSVPMLQSAIAQLLSAIVAAALLTVIMLGIAPQNLWMPPGL